MQTVTPYREENKVSELVRLLCGELERQRIVYCHWKSNNALDRSASGENDLDILISRRHVQEFTRILFQFGFKQAHERNERKLPGVLDFYGYDSTLERLIHVHAHYQLVVGHDATKNYRIPIEEAYLASAKPAGMFMVPEVEFELIVLVIRMMLKHTTWDVVALGQGGLSRSEKAELDDLIQKIDPTRLESVLREHVGFIEPGVWHGCLDAMVSGAPLGLRLSMGRKMLRCLAPFARRPRGVDAFLKIWRRFAWPFARRILRAEQRKQMSSGGLMIAVAGGDGAGKTTLIQGLHHWLADEFEVQRIHMGKPRWSLTTVLIRGIIKIGRSLGFYPFQRTDQLYIRDQSAVIFPGYPWLIREVCTARDRYLTYSRAQRIVANGGLVILDRFPIQQVQLMDGPQGARLSAGVKPTRFLQILIDLEESYYRRIGQPDLLIVLLLDPDEAVRRKTDEDAEDVRARSTEIWEIDWSKTSARVVDASQSKAAVLGEVRRLIWEKL